MRWGRAVFAVVVAIGLVFGSYTPASANDTGGVKVTVLDAETDAPIEGADVELYRIDSNSQVSASSDVSGIVEWSSLVPGAYWIGASHVLYEGNSVGVDITADSVLPVTLRLTPAGDDGDGTWVEPDVACEPTTVANGLTNMGFENGLTGWTLAQQVEDVVVTGSDGFTSPFEGSRMGRLGTPQGSSEVDQPRGMNVICQDFTVTRATEHFAFNIFTYDYTGFDNFNFDLIVTNPQTGERLARYTQGAWGTGTELKTSGWRGATLNLEDHIGETVRLTIRAGGTEDELYAYWVYLDSAQSDQPPPVAQFIEEVTTTTGSVTTDPSTGQITAVMPTGSVSDLTMHFVASCASGAEPTEVSIGLNDQVFAAERVSKGHYEVTIPADKIEEGLITRQVRCDNAATEVVAIGTIVLYDPSGYVTDAATGKPVVGAEVHLYKVPGWKPKTTPGAPSAGFCETNESKGGAPWGQAAPTHLGVLVNSASEEISPNVNPFVTNNDGYYGWDVAEGCWYVTVTAPGYAPLTSPVVGVPSEVTDLNLKLTKKVLSAGTPKISGTAAVGKKLTAKPGTWKPSGVKLSYQWKRGGKAIKGATKSTYKVAKADAGKKITVTVTGKKSGYKTVSKTSKSVTVKKLITPATPKISGTAKVGKKLTVKAGKWKPSGVKLSYQWKRGGKAIKGATKSTYKVAKADKGKKIAVTVTGKKSGHATVAKTSKATAKVK